MRLALLLVAVPVLAVAKPLPPGLQIHVVKNRLVATAGGETVELTDHDADKLGKVEVSDDGDWINVEVTLCGGMMGGGDEGPVPFSLVDVQARLENLAGMRAHLKKKYADAIPHFAAAARLDPATALYATNLLSAQTMAGKLDDADQTIATYSAKNMPWFAWRLLVDSDLEALRGRPSTNRLAAPRRGSARSKLGSLPGDRMLYSSLGFAATELEYNMADGIPDGSGSFQLVIVDLATGHELLTLPTENRCAPDDKKCAAKEAAAAVPRRKIADELLATLGFEPAKPAQSGTDDKGETKKEIVAPDGRKLVTDKLLLVHGKKSKTIQLDGRPFEYAFVPGALVVISRTGKHIARCDADGDYRLQLESFPDP